MRMRRKGNLDTRLEAVSDYLINRNGESLNITEALLHPAIVNLRELFGNDNPVDLEIGTGKGKFILEKAQSEPNVNFLGVEFVSNVIIVGAEKAFAQKIKNVRFLNTYAECAKRYIACGSIRNIYINFPTPLPHTTNEKQRLTSSRFLEIYKDLMDGKGSLYLKTDKEWFFDYSLEQIEANGFEVLEQNRDFHKGGVRGIVTEHEKKYMADNLPIYYLQAKPTK